MINNKLLRLLIPNTVEVIMNAKKASSSRMIENLGDIEFITQSVLVSSASTTIKIQLIDDNDFGTLVAGDANRFFLASRLSLNRARQDHERNASWQAIEHYYAAYYAVHYLIRMTGVSLTNLDQSSIDSINRKFIGVQPSQIPTGLYVLTYNEQTKELILNKKTKKGAAGSHVNAWQLWLDLVEKLTVLAKSDAVEYVKASLELSLHKQFVSITSGAYRPPELRNAINYRFEGQSWIFEKISSKMIGKIQSAIRSNAGLGVGNSLDLIGLIENNHLVTDLAKDLFVHTSNSYPKSIFRSVKNQYANYF